MKTDAYTKAVLTIIASCLLYAVIKDAVQPAYAQTPIPVNIVQIGPYLASLPLEVKVLK